MKEYLSRGTYIFPPEASKRLTVDLVTYTVKNAPMWNPINVCPYHLQEAGATPVQELAYGLANAIAVLDAVRESGQVPEARVPRRSSGASRSSSTRACASSKRCARCARSRACGTQICRERYGVKDEKLRRFRYGMQVNSLGLTEEQPENNVQRIVLEMLGRDAVEGRAARAIQLPCWNEALGLPTPWDQQWSLRIQQVLAYESDLLEYGDLFEGSVVVERKVAALCEEAAVELQWVLDGGGSFAMIDEMKGRIVQAGAERVRNIESGELKVVGVNSFTETEPSPLADSAQHGGIVTIDPAVEAEHVEAIAAWRGGARRRGGLGRARARCRRWRATNENLVPATIALAKAGGTVGEWAGALREVFGEYRAPTGVGAVAVQPGAEMEAVRGAGAVDRGGDGPPDPAARRQARPRRPLERRRTDRGGGPRCRLRGRLPGHPPDPGRDRGRGPRRGRRRRGAFDPFGLPPRPGARHAAAARRRPGSTRRSWSAGSFRTPTARNSRRWASPGCTRPKDYRLSPHDARSRRTGPDHRSKPQAGAAVGR